MKNTTVYSDARVMSAAEKMLVQKGYCIEAREVSELIDLVAYSADWEVLVFFSCSAQAQEGAEAQDEPVNRMQAEREMLSYLVQNSPVASRIGVRFDTLSFLCHGKNALVRHCKSALQPVV